MPENPTSAEVEQLRQQIAELQKQLETTRAQRDEFKSMAYEMLEKLDPYVPPTPEELQDMLHGPRGQSILEIVAEFEKELNQEKP